VYASPRQLRKPVLHKHRRVAYMPFWVGWRYRGDRANRFTVFTLLLPSTVTHSYSPPSLDSMHKTFRTANSCSVRGWVENFDQPTKLTLSRIRTWISYKHTHTHTLSLSLSVSLLTTSYSSTWALGLAIVVFPGVTFIVEQNFQGNTVKDSWS
jgi:hypothetical protein